MTLRSSIHIPLYFLYKSGNVWSVPNLTLNVRALNIDVFGERKEGSMRTKKGLKQTICEAVGKQITESRFVW